MHTRISLLIDAVILCLVLGACASEPLGPPVDIRFTVLQPTPELTVSGVTARPGEDSVTFSIEYTSGSDRRFSFFNPPDGKVFMVTRDLSEGSHTARVTISNVSLRQVSHITVKFFAPKEAGYLFLNFADIKPLLEKGSASVPSVPSEPLGPPVDVQFTVLQLVPDLTISSVKASASSTSVVFTFAYKSSQDQRLCLFNPPHGNVVKQFENAPANRGTVSVTVPKASLRQVTFITANFLLASGDGNGFFSLNYADIKPLLE